MVFAYLRSDHTTTASSPGELITATGPDRLVHWIITEHGVATSASSGNFTTACYGTLEELSPTQSCRLRTGSANEQKTTVPPVPVEQSSIHSRKSTGLRSSTNTLRGILPCPYCSTMFDLSFVLKRHLEEVHGTNRYYCNCCDRLFKRKEALERHQAKRTNICPGCQRRFRPDHLKSHLTATRNGRCLSTAKLAAWRWGPDAEVYHTLQELSVLPDLDTLKSEWQEADDEMVLEGPTTVFTMEAKSSVDPAIVQSAAAKSGLEVQADSDLTQSLVDSTPLALGGTGWHELQLRASSRTAKQINSVELQVRRRIRKPKASSEAIQLGSTCEVCGLCLGTTANQLLSHAATHLSDMPKPSHVCYTCETPFLFRQDLEQHCYDEKTGRHVCENEAFSSDDMALWARDAIKKRFIDDLRLWEKYQIIRYLDEVLSAARRYADNKKRAAMSARGFRDSWATLLTHWSLSSYRSCPSGPQPVGGLAFSDLASKFSAAAVSIEDDNVTAADSACEIVEPNDNFEDLPCPGMRSDVVRAAIRNDIPALKSALKTKHFHCCDVCKGVALRFAVSGGRLDAVNILLKHGVDPNAASSDILPRSPIDLAVSTADTEIVHTLLRHGAKVLHDNAMAGPLLAADSADATTLQLLLRAGFDPDSEYDDESLLIYHTRRNRAAAVKLLLENKAFTEKTDTVGKTALHIAAENDFGTIAGHLLKHEADPGASVRKVNDCLEKTPLMFAAEKGNTGIVSLLLAEGPVACQASSVDAFGRSALHLACDNAHKSPLDYAIIAQKLVSVVGGIDDRDALGITPLIYAAKAGSLHLVQLLLNEGAAPNLKATNGMTALGTARKHRHSNVADLLETVTTSQVGRPPSITSMPGSYSSQSSWSSPASSSKRRGYRMAELSFILGPGGQI